jgi:hypothetical protein
MSLPGKQPAIAPQMVHLIGENTPLQARIQANQSHKRVDYRPLLSHIRQHY